MDHQWHPRPPPPIQGNICPTCSISHFPFCPSPHTLPFDQNPRFHPHNMDSLKRPFYDPFLDHQPSIPPPFSGDRFGDPPPWHRNPGMDYGHYQAEPQIGDYGSINGGRANDFEARNEFGGVGFKRMRVDEMGTGSLASESMLTDKERRLKLIREHGGALGDMPPGTGIDAYGKSPAYMQEKPVSDRNFSSVENLGQERFDALRFSRNDLSRTPHSKNELGDYSDSRYGDLDRKQFSLPRDSNYGLHPYEKDNGEHAASENLHGYQNEGIGQARYDQRDNGLHPRKDHLGGGVGAACYEGGVRGDVDLGDRYSLSAPYATSKTLTDKYYQNRFESPLPHHSLSEPTHTASIQRSSYTLENKNHGKESEVSQSYARHDPVQLQHDMNSYGQASDWRNSYKADTRPQEGTKGPLRHQDMPGASQFGTQYYDKQGGHVPFSSGRSIYAENPIQASRALDGYPPLPASPPPPLPVEPPRHPMYESHSLSPPTKTPSLFPITGAPSPTPPSSNVSISEARSLARPYFHDLPHHQTSTGFAAEEFRSMNKTYSSSLLRDGQPFPLISSDRPKIVDAFDLFKQPHRVNRPDHFVIILRGLPGSGKSYLAKMLRDLEVENGGNAPRIHSMDDYFMTEVEKADESDSKSSARGKKSVTKMVMEYCYEPEMEEAYRSSMSKAFKKTLDEGTFSLVIVDDRNLRVADFAQFWATAKRSGYEVYLLEATYKDPAGCAARNVHGFTQDDIKKMAAMWEEAPPLYLKLDVKSLFQGDDLKESGIQEVDMDTGDGDSPGRIDVSEQRNSGVTIALTPDHSPSDSSRYDKKWDAEGDPSGEEIKELGRSKWSSDLDDHNEKVNAAAEGNSLALSGLMKAYAKGGKSVHWGDKAGGTGFSIGAARLASSSLVIGPGAGYNLKSNPLPEEQALTAKSGETKTRRVFQERLRAERESFKAVFDKRRHRIGRRLDLEED